MPGDVLDDPSNGALWLRRALQRICDATMPRVGPPAGGRRSAYWWCAEIADLRAASVIARRRYTNARRRDSRWVTGDVLQELRSAYSAARRELRGAIARAKTRSHEEFLATLNEDPWGRPYKAVSIKLGPWAPPVTEGLEPRFLLEVLSALFPPSPGSWGGWRRRFGRPGVDVGHRHSGCPEGHGRGARVRGASNAFEERCTRTGRGARASLGLRDERPWERPQARVRRGLEDREVSPRVERGEVGAAAEARKARGVALGLSADLPAGRGGQALGARHSCPPLGPPRSRGVPGPVRPPIRLQTAAIDGGCYPTGSDRCRAGRPRGGGVSVAVSLDIANAFNTVSWAAIERALVFHSVPLYLRRLVWGLPSRPGGLVRRPRRRRGGSRAPRRATGIRSGAPALEPGVRRGVAGGDAVTGRVARVLRRRHAGGGHRAEVAGGTGPRGEGTAARYPRDRGARSASRLRENGGDMARGQSWDWHPQQSVYQSRGGLHQGRPIDEVSRSDPGYLLAVRASLSGPGPQVGATGVRLRAHHAQPGRPARGVFGVYT